MLGERKSSGQATTTRKARKGNCCHPGFPERTDPRGRQKRILAGRKGKLSNKKGLKKGNANGSHLGLSRIYSGRRPFPTQGGSKLPPLTHQGRFPPPARNLLLAPKTSQILSLPLSPSSKKARLLPPAAKKRVLPTQLLSVPLPPPLKPPRP